METDVNWTYRGDHFLAYANIESLCCTPKINIMLFVNCTAIKKNKGWSTIEYIVFCAPVKASLETIPRSTITIFCSMGKLMG